MLCIWAVVLIVPGLHVCAQADSFSFDVGPLSIKECTGRPPSNCGPRSIRRSDCAFLEPRDKSSIHRLLQEFDDKPQNSSFKINDAVEQQTYITLKCNYPHSENVTVRDLAAQVRAIRKRSPRRMINLDLQDDTLLDPETFMPVSHQVVLFSLSGCTNSTVTSRLPFLNFTSLLDFTLVECQVAITVRKADFSYLQKIRFIRFSEIRFNTIEPGTFTDLPDLMTFWIQVYGAVYTDDSERGKAWHRLHCDTQFDWLWEWLDKNPGLGKVRPAGAVYRIGSLENPDAWGMTRDCRTSPATTKPWMTEFAIVQLPE